MLSPTIVPVVVLGAGAVFGCAILIGKWFKRRDQPTSNPYYSPDLAAKAWADPVDRARFLSGDWGVDDDLPRSGSLPVDWDKVIAAGEKLKEIQDRAKARVDDAVARSNFSAPFGKPPADDGIARDGDYLQTRDCRPIMGRRVGSFAPAIPANVIFSREGSDFYFIGHGGRVSLGQAFYDAWLPWANEFPQDH